MIPAVFIVAAFSRFVLPKLDSDFFKKIVLRSLMNRYANFVRSGDKVRAKASAELLERLGYPVPEELRG